MLRQTLVAIVLFAIYFLADPVAIAAQVSVENSPPTRPDKLAIQDSIAGYLLAINERDADAAASYWSENGEWIGDDGIRVKGTKNIAAALARSFAAEPPELTVSLRNLSIRMVSANVAIEDGVVVNSMPNQADSRTSYSVVHVKENGKWKISAVRETSSSVEPEVQTHPLESLSWLVGDWQDQSSDGLKIETSCNWTEGGHALRRSFSVSDNGKVIKKGTQVILWDVRLGKIRSWIFDSDGGFGNGFWEAIDSKTWSVDAEYQLADGGLAKATNIYSNITNDRFSFTSVNRTIDGVQLEDMPSIMVLKEPTRFSMNQPIAQQAEQSK